MNTARLASAKLKKSCLYLWLYISFFLLTANAFAAGSGDIGLQNNLIEPSFFTKPVPVAEWEAKLIQKAKTRITAEYYTNRFSYDTNDRNAKYDDFQEDQLNDMDAANRTHARKLYAEEVMKRRGAAGR